MNSIISMTCDFFVCFMQLSVLSVAKVKAEVSLSTWDLPCAAKITHSIITWWLGLERGCELTLIDVNR